MLKGTGWGSSTALRRAFDLLAAGLGLLLLAPVLLAIALWVRLDSPGPALFRQTRVGQGGRLFRIRKFRTMGVAHSPEESGSLEVTIGNDPRITRAGRFLRRCKLDELPQLLDVVQGHMALVGPRPEVPQHVGHWPPALRERILAVRPGLTDPASLAFADEAERLARAADPAREYREVITPAKLAMSARYLDERSLASDLRLILTTLARLRPRLTPRADA